MSETNGTTGMRGCVACGAANEAEARFCAQCGARLPQSVAPGQTARITSLLNDARQQVLLGHWEDAGLAAEGILALDADIAEAHHIAAVAGLRQGMRASAVRHAQRAVELEPESAEYQATMAMAEREAAEVSLARRPVILGGAVGLVAILLIITLALAGRDRTPSSNTIIPTSPSGPASQFVQPPGTPMPQPSRSPGVATNRPRVPVRSTPPGPMAADGAPDYSLGTVPSRTQMAAGPTASPLSPAPVDTSRLQRFPAPEAPAVSTPAAPAERPTVRNEQPRGVVAPPPAQPGGTIFGGTVPPLQSSLPTTTTAPAEATAGEAPSAAEAPAANPSPQQYYVERQYGQAISGLEQRIAAGQATGSNYQQLGMSYQRVGNRAAAEQAYENAVAAYRAQLQAGQDADLATRGLRASETALRLLRGR